MKRRKLDREDSQDDLSDESDSDCEPGPGPGPGAWPRPQSLVVGGSSAAPGQFPYLAALQVSRGEQGQEGIARCGATLISDRWLITAAHCCKRGTKIQVYLGSHRTMEDAQQRMHTSMVLIHPLYSRSNPGHNDLALIRLPKRARLNDRVRPVRLPAWRHRAVDFAGKVATLTGWGKTSDTDQRPAKGTSILRFAKEKILTSEEAESLLERKLPPNFVCARGLRGEMSCNGDSGGPLTVEDDSGRPMLVGVVSHRYGQLCSTSKAHVCTRVTSFLPWIASVTRVAIEH